MIASASQVREAALALAAHAEGLAEAVMADQSAHSRALLMLDQVKILVAWTASELTEPPTSEVRAVEAAEALTASARGVIRAWEGGDLAHAVSLLAEDVETYGVGDEDEDEDDEEEEA